MSRMHFSNYRPSDADLAELADYNEARMSAYRAALASMDWHYRQADDMSAYRAAEVHLEALRNMQPDLDPDGAIWLSVAPEGLDIPQPRKQP